MNLHSTSDQSIESMAFGTGLNVVNDSVQAMIVARMRYLEATLKEPIDQFGTLVAIDVSVQIASKVASDQKRSLASIVIDCIDSRVDLLAVAGDDDDGAGDGDGVHEQTSIVADDGADASESAKRKNTKRR